MEEKKWVGVEGEGIKLLKPKDFNYGLTSYKPKEDWDGLHGLYKGIYELYKKEFDEKGYINLVEESSGRRFPLSKEESEKLLISMVKCDSCAALKINNYKRYCCKCEYFFNYDKYFYGNRFDEKGNVKI